MSNSLTLRETMSIDNFDPMAIDISEFQTIAAQMPKDDNLDIGICQHLAIAFLQASDRCSEINASLLWYTQKMKQEKNTIKQKLYLLAKNKGHNTIQERTAYSESHPDFITACDKLTAAEAVKAWFDDKQSWFLESHRFMKAKLKAENQNMISSGFSGTTEEKSFGEKQW